MASEFRGRAGRWAGLVGIGNIFAEVVDGGRSCLPVTAWWPDGVGDLRAGNEASGNSMPSEERSAKLRKMGFRKDERRTFSTFRTGELSAEAGDG